MRKIMIAPFRFFTVSAFRLGVFAIALTMLASDASIAQSNEATGEATGETSENGKSVDILLVTGGCCHDYDFQAKAMQLAIKKHGLQVNWTVINDGGTGTDAQISLYDDPNWADSYDLVIHNECFASTKAADYIRRITKAHHDGANAIVIHCAMHTYRDAEIDDWREFLGVKSRRHDHQSRYPVTLEQPDHPIMQGVPENYVSATDELYVIEKVWPNTVVLATSESETTKQSHPVFWTNQYGKAKVFGTTYGHSNDTFSDPVFLGVLCRAVEWLTQLK